MKRYIKSLVSNDIEFNLKLEIRYVITDYQKSLAASSELDSMDLSNLDTQIINIPDYSDFKDIVNTEAYKKFIEFVNKVDELLELRNFEVLGESEKTDRDSESEYRGIVVNVVKVTDDLHVSGKIEHILRLFGHKESRTSRRNRADKQQKAANSPEALALNNGNPLEIGEFESIRVMCIASEPAKANIKNKEFYSYLDALQCVDGILDFWM